jgi:hypothetical protein
MNTLPAPRAAGADVMDISGLRARTISVFIGCTLLLLKAALPDSWFEKGLLVLFTADICVYLIVGLALGWVWPRSGWRLALYLFSPVVLVQAIGLFLAGDQPAKVPLMLLNLLGYLLTFVAACVGAKIGASIAARR